MFIGLVIATLESLPFERNFPYLLMNKLPLLSWLQSYIKKQFSLSCIQKWTIERRCHTIVILMSKDSLKVKVQQKFEQFFFSKFQIRIIPCRQREAKQIISVKDKNGEDDTDDRLKWLAERKYFCHIDRRKLILETMEKMEPKHITFGTDMPQC